MKMKVFGLLVGLAAMGSVASAVTIADIQARDCHCIVFGDKIFNGFATGGIDGSLVNVTGSQVGDTVFINFGGNFFTTNTTTGADFQLFYHVTALAGLIQSIDQSFNLSGSGTGGLVSIGETVYSDAGRNFVVANSTVGFFIVPDQNDPPGEVAQGDQLNINPALSQVWVTKDIFLRANEGGAVGATIITQSFHQTAVPEPMTLSLMGVGLLGLGLLRRRMR